MRGLGMRVLVPAAARALAPRDRRRRLDARRPRRRPRRAGGEDRRRAARASAAAAGSADAGRASCAQRSGSATGRCVLSALGQAAAQEPRAAARRAGARSRRSAGRCSCCPGYPTPHEAELRAHAAALGVADDVRFPGWVRGGRLEGLYAAGRRVRVPVALRGLRAARARGDGARRAGRVLGPRVAAGGGRRRGAAVRPRGRADAIRAAIERLLWTTAERRRLADAGRARAAGFTWERTAELTLGSYAALAGRLRDARRKRCTRNAPWRGSQRAATRAARGGSG